VSVIAERSAASTRKAAALLAVMISSMLAVAQAASIEFVSTAEGATRVDLLGDKPWDETALVDLFPREGIAWSDQQWPVIHDINSGERKTIGQLRLYSGQKLTGQTHSKPGKSSAPPQNTYPYQVPVLARNQASDGSYRLSSPREQMIVASRGGVVATIDDTDQPPARFLRIVHNDGSVGSYLGLSPYPASAPGAHVEPGQPLGVSLPNLEFRFRVEIPTPRFVPGDQYAVQPVVTWRNDQENGQGVSSVLPDPLQQAEQAGRLKPGEVADPRGGQNVPIPIPTWFKRLLVIAVVASLLWFLWTLRPRQRARSERLREGETSYRHTAYQAGRSKKPHLDAYARLLRAVSGDVARAEALINYEIKRGAKRSHAALDALDRLIRDRGY
jgi:hypothetical protein